jgi:hypothetical protein
MAQTVWSPAPYISKQEWLLADGTVVTSPEFEATSSGRRVRVAGTKESIGSRQVETLIQASIDKIANERGTHRLVRIFPEEETDQTAATNVSAPDTVFTDAVTLHLLNEQQAAKDRGRTVAVWKYRDAQHSPVVAYVFVTLEQRYNDTYQVHTHLVWRDTRPTYASTNSLLVADGSYIQGNDMYRYGDPHQKLQERLNNGLLPFTLGSKNYGGQMRTAVVKFAEQSRLVDQFDELSVPDSANPKVSRTFKRVASNYSAAFNAELLDFVQTGPVLERIKENYDQLLQDFKTLGIVVTERIDGGDLAQAIHGNLTKIQATVRTNEDENEGEEGSNIDPHHTVAFDFATGTVVVNCGHSHDLDETAQAWEIAKFKAEMTGEVDALLEYARAYRDPKEQARLRKIIKQRKIDINNPDNTP